MTYFARIFLFISCLFLSSCGFHLRSSGDVSPYLKKLYLSSSEPYSELLSTLKDQLQSLQVNLVKKPHQAPITLMINDIQFSHTRPSISDTNMAVDVNYSLVVTAQLQTAQGKVLAGPQRFSSNVDQLLNATQIYTANTAALANQALQQEVLALLLDWLTSPTMKTQLAAYYSHAN